MSKDRGGEIPPIPFRIEGFTSVLNHPGDAMTEQAAHNARTGLPWVFPEEAHDRTAIVVGGGPSLGECLPALLEAEGDIYALNGTHDYLIERGIVPTGMILLDSRPENVRFVQNPRKDVTYYVSVVCHPDILEALEGYDVKLWANGSQETDFLDALKINGGATVGLKAPCLLYSQGYRKFHLFGYDSCYRDDRNHAYAQDLNDGETVNPTWVGGRKFMCAPWMAKQGREFVAMAALFRKEGCEIAVTGDGLIPEILKAMNGYRTPLSLNYDLNEQPSSYDFVQWLANADMQRRAMGCDRLKVNFVDGERDDGLPATREQRKTLLEHVVKPAVSLLPDCEIGGCGESEASVPHTPALATALYREGVPVPRFGAPESARAFVVERLKERIPVIITLREADYWPERNSDLDAWMAFAETLDDVIFVRDTARADEPLPFETFPEASRDLHIRTALYEAASLNMLVSNGPVALLWYLGKPFISFVWPVEGYTPHDPERWKGMTGTAWGEQFPWFSRDQRIVYGKDTSENISTAYLEWKEQA